jgi:hypothetical protein
VLSAPIALHPSLADSLVVSRADVDEDGSAAVVSFLATPGAVAWLRHEWFVSTLDAAALGVDEFRLSLQQQLNVTDPGPLTRCQWAHLRARLGRVRRLSPSFLQLERARLATRRAMIRKLQQSNGLVRLCLPSRTRPYQRPWPAMSSHC